MEGGVNRRPVDNVAVRRVLDGHGHGIRLNRDERQEAVRIGTDRGMTAATLADLLDVTTRTVVRDRAAARTC